MYGNMFELKGGTEKNKLKKARKEVKKLCMKY